MSDFVITNKLYYIARKNCMYQPVSKIDMAVHFDNRLSAENILKQLPKVLRGKGYAVEEAKAPVIEQKNTGLAWKSAPLKECGVPEVEEMARSLENAAGFMNEWGKMVASCRDGIMKQSKIQEDLLHAMEFESGAKGHAAHLFSRMQKCRKARRAYADMYDVLSGMGDMTPKTFPTKYLQTRQQVLDSRMYTPRSDEVFKEANA